MSNLNKITDEMLDFDLEDILLFSTPNEIIKPYFNDYTILMILGDIYCAAATPIITNWSAEEDIKHLEAHPRIQQLFDKMFATSKFEVKRKKSECLALYGYFITGLNRPIQWNLISTNHRQYLYGTPEKSFIP